MLYGDFAPGSGSGRGSHGSGGGSHGTGGSHGSHGSHGSASGPDLSFNDYLDGGAGNDQLYAQQGDDTANYTWTDHLSAYPDDYTDLGNSDAYDGGFGSDTLQLTLTYGEAKALSGEIADYQAFLAANANPNSDNGPTFNFTSFDLAATDFEELLVNLVNTDPVAEDDTNAGDEGNETDASLLVVGNVLANDFDTDHLDELSVVAPGVYVGAYGTLTLDADGSYSYDIDDSNSVVDSLNIGGSLDDVFSYDVQDLAGATDGGTLTITIDGTNDAPVALADSNSGDEGNETVASVPITGNVLANDTDVDNANAEFTVTTAGTVIGTYGTLTLDADGGYSYAIDDSNSTVDGLNIGDSVSETFSYTMSDNQSGDPKTSSAVLTITIDGTNDAPVAQADADSGAEGNETVASSPITGNVLTNDTDVDNANTEFTVTTAGTVVGTYGTLTLDADGGYSYAIDDTNPVVDALNGTQSVSETFSYTMSDNQSGDPKTSSAVLTITIDGTNDAPVAKSDAASGAEGNETVASSPVTGNVLTNDTDVDNANPEFTVTTAGIIVGSYGTLTLDADGGYSYAIDDTNPVVDALNGLQSVSETFSYTMSDNQVGDPKTSSSDLTITITGTNDAPVAENDALGGGGGGGGGELLVNGGFETGDFTGWETTLVAFSDPFPFTVDDDNSPPETGPFGFTNEGRRMGATSPSRTSSPGRSRRWNSRSRCRPVCSR